MKEKNARLAFYQTDVGLAIVEVDEEGEPTRPTEDVTIMAYSQVLVLYDFLSNHLSSIMERADAE